MTLECPLEKLPLRVPHPATGQGWLPRAAVLPLRPHNALCIQTLFPGKGGCQNGAVGHYSLLCVNEKDPILHCCFTGKLLMLFSSPHEHLLSAALPSIPNCFTEAQCCNQLAELSPKHLKKQESCCFEKLLLETDACHPFISFFPIL